MKSLLQIIIAVYTVNLVVAVDPTSTSTPDKFVCYWNSSSFVRSGPAKVEVMDLKPALSLCTHLIYGFAGINSKNYEVIPLNPKTETDVKSSLYREVISLKNCFPTLKIYLSVGGYADPDQNCKKYLTLVETASTRNKFIKSVEQLLTDYDFDGVDLAWQFPPVSPKKTETSLKSSLVSFAKNTLGFGDFKDDKVLEHRRGFSNLVWDLKALLKQKNKALTLTVLPHVNASEYYDPQILTPSVDAIHLMAFDKVTPERDPKQADYPAPIYGRYGAGQPENCVDENVNFWLNCKDSAKDKIVIGIPTHARTWKLSKTDIIISTGVPPLPANGPGPEGPLAATPGLLSYPEVCTRLNDKSLDLKNVQDTLYSSKSYGSYAYSPYNPKTNADGVWIGYESVPSAENKALYVKKRALGGVAIWDLSNDDFHGTCDGNRFPLTSAAKFKLS